VSKTMNKKKGTALSAVKLWLNEHNIIYAVVFLAIILTFVSRKFLTLDNMMNILRQTSMVAIIAVGAFYTIVGGGSTCHRVQLREYPALCLPRWLRNGDSLHLSLSF